MHDIDTTEEKLDRCRRRFPEKYQEIQEGLAQKIEAVAITGARANIANSNAPIALAIERAHQALKDGRVGDPAKMGRELADIQTKQKDTMMALQGRPVVTKEIRTIEEVFRGLEAIDPSLVIQDADVVETEEIVKGTDA